MQLDGVVPRLRAVHGLEDGEDLVLAELERQQAVRLRLLDELQDELAMRGRVLGQEQRDLVELLPLVAQDGLSAPRVHEPRERSLLLPDVRQALQDLLGLADEAVVDEALARDVVVVHDVHHEPW